MHDPCTEWEKWLIRRMGDHFAEACRDGVTFDAVAVGAAYIRYGANLAIHGAEVPRETVATFLDAVGESVESGSRYMPSLFSLPMA
ncbi:MAG: hypothetical protein HQL42_10925 [Alphaproteobacteria bacterium]|nr:hypothetical protein [Alphaproteobacteria bacterium]